jgi:hypothetical protein
MILECKNCGFKQGKPMAVGGVITMLPAGCITGILCGIFGATLSLWVILLALPLWFFLTWVFWEGPRWFTYLRYGRRACPRCGVRAWNKPQYSGFGL